MKHTCKFVIRWPTMNKFQFFAFIWKIYEVNLSTENAIINIKYILTLKSQTTNTFLIQITAKEEAAQPSAFKAHILDILSDL